MEITKLVEYINIELSKDKDISVNKICNKLGMKQSTVKSQLRREGYSFNADSRAYIKGVGQNGGQKVVQRDIQDIEVVKVDTPGAMTTINNYLNDNANILIEIIEQYKKSNDIGQVGGIVVQLPGEVDGEYKTSVRVNKIVMEQFREFCNRHKQFTQKELLSQALLEFIDNHS